MREAKLEKEDFDSTFLTKLDNVQKKFVTKGNVSGEWCDVLRRKSNFNVPSSRSQRWWIKRIPRIITAMTSKMKPFAAVSSE